MVVKDDEHTLAFPRVRHADRASIPPDVRTVRDAGEWRTPGERHEDRVPRVEEVDGRPMWLLDGEPFSFAGGGAVIDREGGKHPHAESQAILVSLDAVVGASTGAQEPPGERQRSSWYRAPGVPDHCN